MIELIVFPRPNNPRLLNLSPFCAKTEVLLKICNVEHKIVEYKGNLKKFPKGKLPVICHKGHMIADSSLIENYIIKEFNIQIDSPFSKPQKAQGFAFCRMIEEFLYWSILWERWLVEENWVRLRDRYFGDIPALIRPIITRLIQNKVRKSTLGQGMGRHEVEQIYNFGESCIESLADFLQARNFLLGETISTYDASFYAFISNILYCDLNPRLRKSAEQHANLVNYCERMTSTLS